MSSIGTGYDLSASTYSPDGRIFQVEYATKAVDNSGTSLGIRCKDGVVVALENLKHSKLLTPVSKAVQNGRIQAADAHVGCASSGILADGRHVIGRAKEECKSYRDIYRSGIRANIIAERIGMYVQAYTLYSSVRPFAASVIVASMDQYDGPQLYMVEPSGLYWGYNGCAAGKGRAIVKTELEKLDFQQLTVREAVKHAARIINLAHDESKDRDYELEVAWVCEESKMKFQRVPQQLIDEAVQLAQQSSADSDRDEMED